MEFVSGFLLSLSLCLDLGVVNIALIRSGLQRGFSSALLFGFGSCFGDITYAALSIFGLSLLLSHFAVRVTIWVVGSLVLAWLTVRTLLESFRRSSVDLASVEPASASLKSGVFLRGLILALSSPTSILWFVSVGGSIIAADTGARSAGAVNLVPIVQFLCGFFVAGFTWSLMLAYVSGRIGRRLNPRWIQGLSFASGILLLYFTIRVAISGFSLLT